MEILLLVGRIIFGAYFAIMGVMHFKNLKPMTGYATSKGIPMPAVAVVVSGLMIFLGGLGVLVGQYVEVSLGLIALFLLVISFSMHAFWRETDASKKASESIQFFKNIALFGASLSLLALSFGL